jgi:hypothetical protein
LAAENFGKLFFEFFYPEFKPDGMSQPRYRRTPKVTILLLFRVRNTALKLKVAHALPWRFASEKEEGCAILFREQL